MLPLIMSVLMAPDIEFDYKSMKGFFLNVKGVPVVRGSFFQVYEKGWKKGYYSSRWRPQEIKKLQDGSIQVRFESLDRRVAGEQVYIPTPQGIRVNYEFKWKGRNPVKLENTVGLLWAPVFEQGVAMAGAENNSELERRPKPTDSIAKRMILGRSSAFKFSTPLVDLLVRGTKSGNVLFDARRYPQEWADSTEVFWMGHQSLDLEPDVPLRYSVEWIVEPKPTSAGPAEPLQLEALAERSVSAIGPVPTTTQIIPKPKSMRSLGSGYCPADRRFLVTLPPGFETFQGELEQQLGLRWRRHEHSGESAIPIKTATGRSDLAAEGYELRIQGNEITVAARDGGGVVEALRTLAQLARPRDGRLVFPEVEIRDWPSVEWRGVHVFVGPKSLPFHRRLFERVLVPLKFNKVVVQCERTEWESTPGIAVPTTTPKAELSKLFEMVRSYDIEPIPLIQSFGHMQWLFANGQNLELAINRDFPYAIDPRKQASRDLLSRIWREACDLLKPETVHFGCDEVSSRSWSDMFLTTRLWQQQIPFLGQLARDLEVQPMFWGDMALSAAEAPDATHGDTQDQADMRKRSIPAGSLIGDWHYRPTTDAAKFKSLRVWKDLGMHPIATSWYRAENIYGHTHAAIEAGAGTLQSTWAGYINSDQSIYNELEQYAAYVLAADYAWSGRRELPSQLAYKPDEVFRRLYFSTPSAVGIESGWHILPRPKQRSLRIGEVEFGMFAPIGLHWLLGASGQQEPRTVVFNVNVGATELAFAIAARAWVAESEAVGEIVIRLKSGREIRHPLVYGRHLRSTEDPRPTLFADRTGGVSALRIPLGSLEGVASISVRSDNDTVGLQILGVTAL